jgi:parvulin-like peptidyl-prolyl isomerase
MSPQGSGLLPTYLESASARTIDGTFGTDFSQNLDELEAGQWTGPVESGYGAHLVLLQERVPGFVPELADIRPIVEREWANKKRTETRQTINEKLLADYDVVIEWPTG